MWLISDFLIIIMGLLGHRLAAPAMPEEMRPELLRAVLVMANLYCVYVAVGGIAFLVSAVSDHRGRAMAIVFGIVLASFLLNFVAQFWEPAKRIAFLGVMEYYQPARILQSGISQSETWPSYCWWADRRGWWVGNWLLVEAYARFDHRTWHDLCRHQGFWGARVQAT